MKMKKTLIMAMVIAMILSIVSVVNAAGSMTAPTNVKKGDTVKVTVNFGKKMHTSDFKITFDNKLLKYEKSDANIDDVSGSTVRLGTYMDDTDKVTLTFTALKDGVAKIDFSAIKFTNTDLKAEDVSIKSVTVKIGTEKEEKEEETPKKYPQTGVNYVAVAGVALVAIAGVAIVNKKYQK